MATKKDVPSQDVPIPDGAVKTEVNGRVTILPPVEQRLAALRVPFKDHQVSALPKPTKAQTDEVKADFQKGIRCTICGGWHHPKVVHLDYVGHAAVTDRLLDTDIAWEWNPLALNEQGLPLLDATGGLWIKLTICGVTRLGYGDAEAGKKSVTKELIGDAIRNAAMRFGVALDLWHKGELHKGKYLEEADTEITTTAASGIKTPVAAATKKQSAPAVEHPVQQNEKQVAEPVAKDAIPLSDDPLAEPGEVKFITIKLANLKVDDPDVVLSEAGVPVLDGLTKSGFAAIKAALSGKK